MVVELEAQRGIEIYQVPNRLLGPPFILKIHASNPANYSNQSEGNYLPLRAPTLYLCVCVYFKFIFIIRNPIWKQDIYPDFQ